MVNISKKPIRNIYIFMMMILIYISCFADSNIIIPIILSLCAHAALIGLIFRTIKVSKIEFDDYEKRVIAIVIFLVILCYTIIIAERKFIYFWDFSNYYNIQMDFHNACQNSFLDAIRYIIRSIELSDYTCFINIFTEVPFVFGDRSIDSYVMSIIINITPYFIIVLAVFIKSFNSIIRITRKSFTVLVVTIMLIPLFHRAILWGQPDAFGLIFIFVIMTIGNLYNFEKLDWNKNIILFIMTILLMITRRWYMYWIVGYYFSFFGIKLIKLLIYKRFIEIRMFCRNIFIFGICSALTGCIILWPMISRIIFYNYSDRYSYYLNGGLIDEVVNQVRYLGLILQILIVLGIIIGTIYKNIREVTMIAVSTWIIAIVGFTRVQNMSYHQSLILLPTYMILLAIVILSIKENKEKICLSGILFFATFNFIGSYSETNVLYNKNIVSKVYMKVPSRNDYDKILEVSEWILEKCENENEAYIIPHGGMYNPDLFRNVSLEKREQLRCLIPYGSAIVGTHKFPEGLLKARYVITVVPFDEGCSEGIAEKYNSAFMNMVYEKRFEKINSFNMDNGYIIDIYERVREVDNSEILYYEKMFSDENEQYPDMFEGVWSKYKQ